MVDSNEQNLFLNFNHLLTIDLFQGKMAIVRIDLHEMNTTSFIILIRVDGIWKMVCERRSKSYIP